MTDINVLEGRIVAALERARLGVDRLRSAPETPVMVAPGDPAALRTQLDEERTVNAQLEERVRALKDRQDKKLNVLEADIAATKALLAGYDQEMQRLQQANAELRTVATQMREALMADAAEPELINRAAMAELEALRAVQAADRAEFEAVIAQLTPIVAEAE